MQEVTVILTNQGYVKHKLDQNLFNDNPEEFGSILAEETLDKVRNNRLKNAEKPVTAWIPRDWGADR